MKAMNWSKPSEMRKPGVLGAEGLEELGLIELYPNAADLLMTVGAYRIALAGLVRQIEKFAEENGEADFYTGEATALLGPRESWPPQTENREVHGK